MKNLERRATRILRIDVELQRVAAELTAAVYCNLALMRETVDSTLYLTLFNSAYSIAYAIINGNSITGTVPLPIFQLLAALRPRVVDLGNSTQFALSCGYRQTPIVGLPPPPTTIGNYGYFCHRASSLGGVLVDLKDISVSHIGPFPEHGYPNVIQVGTSLGPLNISYSTLSRYALQAIRQVRPKTEEWMKYFTWAYVWDIESDYDIQSINFPPLLNGVHISPGSIALTAALRVADVVGCDTFDFPCIDLNTVKAFIDTNALKRAALQGNDLDREDIRYDLRAALACASGVGLRAGQPAFYSSFTELSSYILPQDIVESTLLIPTFRNGNGRLPYVFTYYGPGAVNLANFDGSASPLVFANASVVGANPVVGISDAEMSIDYSAFINNTYTTTSINTALTWNNSGARPAWAATQGSVTSVAPAAVDWTGVFANTIGNGPLARPSGDRVRTALNFTDVTADRYVVQVTNKVCGFSRINCFAGKIEGPNLATLGSLPLPREAAVVTDSTNPKFNTTPLTQHQLQLRDPAVQATSHTVTESAAKYTEIQTLFKNMQENGLGGAGLFGDIARSVGLVDFVTHVAAGMGKSLVGSAFLAGADYLDYKVIPKKSGNNRKSKTASKKRSGGKRGVTANLSPQDLEKLVSKLALGKKAGQRKKARKQGKK